MKAVCNKCGEFKPTAWKRCIKCNFRPVGDDEKAQHLLLSSHFKSAKELQVISEYIQSGQALEFKKKDMDVVMLVLKDTDRRRRQEFMHMVKLCGVFLLSILMMVAYYFIQTSK
jgi:hypothetical protein